MYLKSLLYRVDLSVTILPDLSWQCARSDQTWGLAVSFGTRQWSVIEHEADRERAWSVRWGVSKRSKLAQNGQAPRLNHRQLDNPDIFDNGRTSKGAALA